MDYKEKLRKALTDNNDVAIEFLLAWIAIMLTSIVVISVIAIIGGA